jgi:alpha-D-xyloside xylohydrolase
VIRDRTTASPGDYDSLQKQYTALTGRQPNPPEFALGYQQSKLRYWNQTQIEDLAMEFKQMEVNVSLIIIDFFAWDKQGDWYVTTAFVEHIF